MSLPLLGAGSTTPVVLPATETVVINAMSARAGGSVFGGTNDLAGTIAALADSSDSTGYGLTSTSSITLDLDGIGFADLTEHGGRDVASLVLQVRGSNGDISTLTPVLAWTGITPSSTTWGANAFSAGSPVTTRTSTSKTKSGGGNWTVAEINGMTIDFLLGPTGSGSSKTLRLHQFALVVTYA